MRFVFTQIPFVQYLKKGGGGKYFFTAHYITYRCLTVKYAKVYSIQVHTIGRVIQRATFNVD